MSPGAFFADTCFDFIPLAGFGTWFLSSYCTSSFPDTMDKADVIPIKLNGKNYMNWSFHLKNCGKTWVVGYFGWN